MFDKLKKLEKSLEENYTPQQNKEPVVYINNKEVCVVCGREIPEGRMVCKMCERKYEEPDERDQKLWEKMNKKD